MTYRGDLIIESVGKPEFLPPLSVAAIRRVDAMPGPALPHLHTWTVLTVELPGYEAAHELAVTYSHAADPGHLGWYLDLLGDDRHLFAFLGRLFIVRADAAADGYAEVTDFCIHRGIPADQLDFRRLGAVPSSGRD